MRQRRPLPQHHQASCQAPTLSRLALLIGAGLLAAGGVRAQVQAAARIPANALPGVISQRSGTPVTYTPAVKDTATGRTTATLTQTDATNIVDWKTFDIGRAAQLNIVQPSANAVLLNQVSGGAFENKTVIEGVLNANGRVYLYNPNGIVFGKTGSVNVNTLIASSLKFDEARVLGGLLRKGTAPVLGADAALGAAPGAVLVEGDATGGAVIAAASGGLVLLAAPQVRNAGSLQAPDGQVMLAAGSKVYLAAPRISETGTSLRGLLVEVRNDQAVGLLADAQQPAVGTAENALPGRIDVGHGNATMIGYAVNQNGRISASTSVNLNGSVYLLGRDQAVADGDQMRATRAGPVVLGPGSAIGITADLGDPAKVPGTNEFNRSLVRINGESIQLQPGAQIVAPGGNVLMLAEHRYVEAPGTNPPDPRSDNARVDFGAGSVVDVSGSHGTTLAMDSNTVTVDLRGAELADNLALRESPLYASQVRIDARKGTAIADVSGWLKQRQFGLGEINANGGTVSVVAGAAILQRPGSQINVDGGWVDVASGKVNTTQLRLGNNLVDIGAAKAGVVYDAVVNLPDSAAPVEAGYRQGASAGTVLFSAPVIAQQGLLSGQVQRGVYQRDPAAVGYPLAARLDIGTLTDSALVGTVPVVKILAEDPRTGSFGLGWFGRPTDGGLAWFGRPPGYAAQFRFQGALALGAVPPVPAALPAPGEAFDTGSADPQRQAGRLALDLPALGRAGFTAVSAQTGGNIDMSQPLVLAPGSALQLDAASPRLTPNQGETQPPEGGKLTLNASVTMPGGRFSAKAVSIDVADGVSIDTAGLWTNDRALAQPARDAAGNLVDPVAKSGGSVALAAAALHLGANVGLDVSAGAWMNSAGSVDKGKAGSISLAVTPLDASAKSLDLSTLVWGSGLRLVGQGFGSGGGSLTLVGRNVVIGDVPAGQQTDGDLVLAPALFQQGGFASYDIGANRDLRVASGVRLQPLARQWLLNNAADRSPSGRLGDVASTMLAPLSGPGAVRQATNLTLRAGVSPAAFDGGDAGGLRVFDGAGVVLDPGAALTLRSSGQLEVEGSLTVPAGRIALALTPFATDVVSHSLWLGAAAVLRADGSRERLYTNGQGITTGELLGGGSISLGGTTDRASDGSSLLNPARAAVVVQSGATLSVGGIAAHGLVFKSGSGTTSVDHLASAGGSIDIRSSMGLQVYGSLLGGSGGAGASAGSLTLALEADAAVLNVVKSGGVSAKSAADRAGVAGSGSVLASSLTDGDFGSLRLRSAGAIGFSLASGDQTLTASQSLVLDASTLLADGAARTAAYDSLLKAEVAALKAADKKAGVKRTAAELAEAAAPLARARLSANGVWLGTPATLTLQAPSVQLGDGSADQTVYPLARQEDPTASRTALAGNAALTVEADNIDLRGHGALQGFGTAALSATQNLRLVGVALSDPRTGAFDGSQRGSFWMKGAMALTSAQVLPSTLSDFTLAVGASALPGSGLLSFAAAGGLPQEPLSAGGSITAWAPHIVQAGRLVAPFGRISLGNTDPAVSDILTTDLRYVAGSLTSVAGHGPVPLGTVANGSVPTASTWSALLTGGIGVTIRQNPDAGAASPQRALPGKSIISTAGTITTEADAVLDLSGGGSLFAYGFTPGKGGSRDVLSNNTLGTSAPAKTSVFAILPGYTGQLAPLDGTYGIDGGLGTGDAVWLSGMGDLKPGLYTLLPAHYALLPGAYSVTAVPGYRDMAAAANRVRSDGAWLMAGQLANTTDGSVSARSQGFVVAPQSVVRRQSEFALYDAGSYFGSKAAAAGISPPELPADAGHVVFASQQETSNALRLQGQVRLGGAAGGLAGTADVAATRMEIASGVGTGAAGVVRLSAGQLAAWQARRLTLGAVYQTVDGQDQLAVQATELTLSNDQDHPLVAPEVLLAANRTLRLQPQAAVVAEGGSAAQTGAESGALALPASGALLRVSTAAAIDLQRSAISTSGNGILDIGAGALVAGSGAVQIDATGSATQAGTIRTGAGGAFTAAAPRISVGDAIPPGVAAASLALDARALAGLANVAQLSLDSRQAPLAVHGQAHVGSAATQHLTLRGSGIAAGSPAAQGVFEGNQIQLQGGTTGATAALAAEPGGSLTLQGDTLSLGAGRVGLEGFAQANLRATSNLRAAGPDGVLSTDGDLLLDSPRITTAPGASGMFQAAGQMRLASAASGNGAAPRPELGGGGQLGFEAASIDVQTRIDAPSGRITLTASQQLSLQSGVVTAAGAVLPANGATVYGPGGSVALQAPQINLGALATVDVSATGADAGRLLIAASNAAGTGAVQFGANLLGAGNAVNGLAAPMQGQFTLDTDSAGLPGALGALNQRLNQAGFTGVRDFRFRHGDAVLDGQDRAVAHDFTLATDRGSITLAGNSVIDASGAKGGSIRLLAGQADGVAGSGQVTLRDSALLSVASRATADAGAGPAGRGGQVLIGTSAATGLAPAGLDQGAGLHLAGGRIDATGAPPADGAQRRDGSVTLRAPRLADGSDVAVSVLATAISPGATTVIEGVQVYQARTVSELPDSARNLDATESGMLFRDAQAFGQQQAAILERLQRSGVAVRPGIEIRSGDDLAVSVNEFASQAADRGWNLHAWRFDGQPVNLTLRAAGNLTVAGSIGDGFAKPDDTRLAMPLWALANGPSADLQLVAGADLQAARPTAVLSPAQLPAGSGNLRLDFADRTPAPAGGAPMKEAGGATLVTHNGQAPVTASDAPVAVVRTGTGRIDVAAAHDVTLAMAKVYVSAAQDETLDQPLVFDSRNSDFSFSQTLFGAALYTAGTPLPPPGHGELPQNALNTHYGAAAGTPAAATFADQGGPITVTAGWNISGPQNNSANWYQRNWDGTAAAAGDPGSKAVPGSIAPLPRVVPQLVNNWLFRQGRSTTAADGSTAFETLADQTTTLNTAWWVRPDFFDQGIATLAGGDLTITAGRSIRNLSASVAATGQVAVAGGTATEHGGGDLRVQAGGDIAGGVFYAQKGDLLLRADGALTAGAWTSGGASGVGAGLAPVLALGDARATVVAGRSLALATAFNPTMTEQSINNLPGMLDPLYAPNGNWDPSYAPKADFRTTFAQFSNFSTYAPGTSVQLVSLGGDVQLSADASALADAGRSEIPNRFQNLSSAGGFANLYTLLPPSLQASALGGDVILANGFTLSPAPAGQLALVAAGSVRLQNGSGGPLRMLDNNPAGMSTAALPRVLANADLDILAGTSTALEAHATPGLHSTDAVPARLTAVTGDILGDPGATVSLALPKAALVSAGRDIVDLGLRIQQLASTDQTVLQAGRDLIDSTQSTGMGGFPSTVAHVVGGPGQLLLGAGRHVDLGNGNGVVTRGNLDNVYLPEGGAAIRVVAGAQAPDYAGFVAFARGYGSAADLRTPGEVSALAAYLRAQGAPGVPTGDKPPAEQVWAVFRTLPAAAQSQYLADHPDIAARMAERADALATALANRDTGQLDARFFALLVETGKLGQKTADGKVIDSSLGSFDTLISSLFPQAAASGGGDISNFGSQFKTEQGGAIALYAPAGSVFAGLTAGNNQKPSESDTGIFTVRGGTIQGLVRQDFLVNKGRVFTLGGGDITLVSQRADIDAGKGAKTAASAPPPLITVDKDGRVAVDVTSSISGSGIATLKTRADAAPGDVFAIAPRGVFDAGDAGVRSSGSVLVVAPIVLNAANISAGGSIAGAQVAVAAPAMGAIAAPANASAKTDDAAKAATNPTAAATALTLTVEALGFGTADADTESDEQKKKRKQR
jgi:filamentous hemagglutinin family protein